MKHRIILGLFLALASALRAIGGQALPVKGHGDQWLEATRKCREMLAKLDPNAPLVRQHAARLDEAISLVRRTESFDWRKRTAVDLLERLLTDLLAGVGPTRRYAGRGLGFPYWSDRLQRVEAIWVHVPPAYDPAREYQLFLYYKCGGGIHLKDGKVMGGYRPEVEVANQTDTFHAWSSLSTQIKGRMGGDYELAEATAALARFFSIDPDRVFLTGWSDGGFTALWLASRFPHLVAGIAPCCANWQYTNVGDVALAGVPTLVVDGWFDGGYNSSQFRRWHTLHTAGADAAGIWGHHGHAYKPYEDIEEFTRILDWAKMRRRDLWPKRVRYATWGLTWHRAFWVSIERMTDPCLAAQIDVAARDGNRIEARTWNVAAYRLSLSDRLLDPAKPIEVTTNGQRSYQGPCKEELLIELAPATSKFVKSAAMPGGITAQVDRSCYGPRNHCKVTDRRWMWVKPTGGDPALLAKWAPDWAKGDMEITAQDMASHNLFVYGGPDVNRFTARIAADLPVTFGKGRFSVGGATYDQPSHCVKLIHPNPLNPKRYVIVYAFNDAATFAANDYFGTRQESVWRFRNGDCVVMGIPSRPRKWGVALKEAPFEERHIIFGADWRAPDETPIGKLAVPLSGSQILRLRADAIRDATDADVALVGEHTPGWSRWRAALPAGPVTAHDVATLDMFPEYVTLADARGDALRALAARAAASSGAADLDPQKTYTVSMAYRGRPVYGAEPRRMPKLHYFETPKQFLAGGHTSLPVRRMRLSPIQVAEATIAYVREHGTLAPPRRTGSSLVDYIENPETEEFGALDWLHLGADVTWKDPQDGRPLPYRYTLNIGLRAATDPERAPPRENSKAFVELDLSGSTAATFAELGKRLPVTAAATARPVTVDAETGARGILAEIRITNRGESAVAGVAAFAPSAIRRIEGGSWPDRNLRRPLSRPYVGYQQAVGGSRKAPLHQNAALLLLDRPGRKVDRLVTPSAGYNFGLVAISCPLVLEGGQAASLPLLFVAVDTRKDGPVLDLAAAIDKSMDDLMGRPAPTGGTGR
jgi:hypothetical protein